MGKVTLQGCITVPETQLEAVKEALVEHIKLTKEEGGCLVFNVTQREGDPLVFDVYEEFVSDEAFAGHQARVQGSAWAEATAEVERDYEITRD